MASAGGFWGLTRFFILSILALGGMIWSVEKQKYELKVSAEADLDSIRFGDIEIFRFSLYQVSVLFTRQRQVSLPFCTLSSRFFDLGSSSVSNINCFRNRHAWLSALLFLSGDLQLNPGPRGQVKFPCGVCKKPCTWSQRAVACDSCHIWFHTNCMVMNSKIYEALANSSISWHCCSCGIPNFNSSLFDDFLLSDLSSNRFSHLDGLGSSFDRAPVPQVHDFKPTTTSTPRSSDIGKSKNSNRPNMKNNLKFLVVNFQSFLNKKEEFCTFTEDSNPDVIIGTETWLDAQVLNSELFLDDFDIYRRDRPNKKGGGVLIAIKKCFTSEPIHSGKDSESLYCRINIKGKKPMVIGSIYRPPNSDLNFCEELCKDIFQIVEKNKKAVFWLGGDFNLPDINWKNEEISGNQNSKQLNMKFLDTTQDLGLKQMVTFPTRGSAFLDLLFTNNPGLVQNCTPVAKFGDHDAVFLETNLRPFRKKPIRRRIQLWNQTDLKALRGDAFSFSKFFLKHHSVKNDVNQLWNCIKNNLTTIMEDHVPTKFTSTKTHQPWISTFTKRLIRKKHRWYKKARSCNSERAWNKFREIKKISQRECRKAHVNFLNSMIEEDKCNKKLWSYIRSKRQENSGISDLRNGNNILVQDPKAKADLLNAQFCSVFSSPEPAIVDDFNGSDKYPDMNNIFVSRPGVLKLLLNIKENKATGPDGIPGRFLKLCAHELAGVYRLLFQASLDQGSVPNDWKHANIVPLFKKGDKLKSENYRPVSLTSVSCKLLEHIVHSNIMDHVDKFHILSDVQHGFRQKRSCETQLITTINDFSDCLNAREQTDAILLDFSKAFDKVDHQGLLLKLNHLGIRNSLLDWIHSFLIKREQKVIVDGCESSSKPVVSGVPQGTVLGPLFFSIYINDIADDLSTGTSIRLFADDSLLYRTIRTRKDAEILQEDLNKLQNWESKWKMEFHPKKCQVLTISNKVKTINSDYFIHNIKLENTDTATYLGIIIDGKLKWGQHYSLVRQKANGIIAFLRRNITNCPPNIKDKCYKTFVRPVLEYGSSVWDPHCKKHIEDLEKIQKRAARFVTNNFKFEEGNTRRNMQRLNWIPLEERRAKIKVTNLFKARISLMDIPIEHLSVNNNRTRRNSQTYVIPQSNVDGHLYSFYPNTLRLWNSLPDDIRTSCSTESFKNKLEKHTLRNCY